MDDKIVEMEEKSAEVRRVTHGNMDGMEYKAAEMAHDKRRKTCYMKEETTKVKAEAYECLAR